MPNEAHAPRSSVSPSPFRLGVTYEGAILEGSLQINPAKHTQLIHVDKPEGREVLDLSFDAARWGGHVWTFRVNTDHPGNFRVLAVRFSTDLGETGTHFSFEVKPGVPPGGRVLFCESYMRASSDDSTITNLGKVTRELEIQANAVNRLPDDLSPFHTVVLHGEGLRFMIQKEITQLFQYLYDGGRIIVLANCFFGESVMWANHLTEPNGITIEDREYDEVLCDQRHLEKHWATNEVKRLRWFRPSPMTVQPPARLLVRNPDNPMEGFMACGGPHENLFVIGNSLLHSLVCEGWPFDNGQLLANLLAKS